MSLGTGLREALRGLRPRRAEPEAVARIKAWARAALDAGEETAFAVNEIACLDPGCPGLETVILVMRPGERTWAAKIAKALGEVAEEDVRTALA